MVTPICTGFTISDTKVSYVLSVTLEYQKNIQELTEELTLKSPNADLSLTWYWRIYQYKQEREPTWIKNVCTQGNQVTESLYKCPTYKRKRESITPSQEKYWMFQKGLKLHTLNLADINLDRVQKWINTYFTYGKVSPIFSSDVTNITLHSF